MRAFAEVAVVSWRDTLAAAFPDRTFTVTLADEPDEYGPTATFWQDRS